MDSIGADIGVCGAICDLSIMAVILTAPELNGWQFVRMHRQVAEVFGA